MNSKIVTGLYKKFFRASNKKNPNESPMRFFSTYKNFRTNNFCNKLFFHFTGVSLTQIYGHCPERKDKIEFFFFPSYSPQLNPEELLSFSLKKFQICFSKKICPSSKVVLLLDFCIFIHRSNIVMISESLKRVFSIFDLNFTESGATFLYKPSIKTKINKIKYSKD